MPPAWHRHYNVRCGVCGVLLWWRITCATRIPREECPFPSIARCPEHRKWEED